MVEFPDTSRPITLKAAQVSSSYFYESNSNASISIRSMHDWSYRFYLLLIKCK